MLSIADTLRPERIKLALAAATLDAAILETASLLQKAPAVLDWDALFAGLRRAAPCLCEQGSDFAICLPHARTEAVQTMVMSIGRSPAGIVFPDCPQPVRYVFCIGVPKALASDYLRIVGLLARILKNPRAEAGLREAAAPGDLLDDLASLEAQL